MKVNYDHEADLLQIRLVQGRSDTSQEVAPGIYVEFDSDGRALGVEITSASRRGTVGVPEVRAA